MLRSSFIVGCKLPARGDPKPLIALFRTVRDYGRMVRLTHSVFALPFALSSAVFASIGESLSARRIFWIVVAMVAARNAAMGFNRLADARIDARNPRTAGREIPRGVLSRAQVAVFVAVLSALFVLAAGMLNRTCLLLSPLALAIVFFYSYTKRFTWGSQFFLGLSLAIAPVGAWLAIDGTLAWPPLLLGASVLLWVAGFDVIYALQDVSFDRQEKLHSIPARFGPVSSLRIARALHAGAVASLFLLYAFLPLHPVYLVGVAILAAILVYEHTLVKPDDLSRVDLAFFTTNGAVSLVYCLFAALSAALGRS
jgi:4-hydroxybenzoate polyprenyltransferase